MAPNLLALFVILDQIWDLKIDQNGQISVAWSNGGSENYRKVRKARYTSLLL